MIIFPPNNFHPLQNATAFNTFQFFSHQVLHKMHGRCAWFADKIFQVPLCFVLLNLFRISNPIFILRLYLQKIECTLQVSSLRWSLEVALERYFSLGLRFPDKKKLSFYSGGWQCGFLHKLCIYSTNFSVIALAPYWKHFTKVRRTHDCVVDSASRTFCASSLSTT